MSEESLLALGRTHTAGELRIDHIGQTVVLMGWVDNRRDHGGAIFVDLRDRYGITQVVFRPDENEAAHGLAGQLRSEYCIAVKGRVDDRGENRNDKIPTGSVEICASQLEIFSASETPPFPIEEQIDTNEALRLKYRYLDLRRPSVHRAFKLRSDIYSIVRSLLHDERFLEVETPFLVKNTPGGARNFIVPSRLAPHHFYALAESPQLFKQLLMVANCDRYFQIVRCFRDEDLRGDRQPEFTQIDLEMSFVREQMIFDLVENLLRRLFKNLLNVDLPTPFPRLSFREAIDRYGSDKPDLRYDLPLTDITDLCGATGFRVFDGQIAAGGIVKLLRVPGGISQLSRRELDALPELVKPVGAKGVAYARLQDGQEWQAPFAKLLSADFVRQVNERAKATTGDVLLFLADQPGIANSALSLLRGEMARRFDLIKAGSWSTLWVHDFPLFELSHETKTWVACHHPFTAPLHDDIPKLQAGQYGEVRARAYDVVLNGVELGGGSIRIHQSDVQAEVFRALGFNEETIQQKFSFLLEAFRYGPPPHGGIALGVDRLVMLMSGAESLRDVIAFPKTQKGSCLMTGAPSNVEEAQLKELHIRLS